MMNIIYGLRDPRNDVYQYIGKSTIGTKRAISHLTHSHSNKVNEWVNELSKFWLYPIVDVIEEVEKLEDLSDREKYWISYYHGINPSLLNIALIDHPILNPNDNNIEKFDTLYSIISEIPQILRKERIRRDISQTELSDKMNIARSTLSLFENGENVCINVVRNYIRVLKGVDIMTNVYRQRTSRTKRK